MIKETREKKEKRRLNWNRNGRQIKRSKYDSNYSDDEGEQDAMEMESDGKSKE